MLKAKRITAMILVLVMVAALAACNSGSTASSGTAPTSTPAAAGSTGAASSEGAPVEETVELSVCVSQTNWGNSIDPDLMDAFVKDVERATNTKINMIAPPHNDYREKLNVMLTSGEIPDVFSVHQSLNQVPIYAIRGYCAPINDYVVNNADLQQNMPADLSSLSIDDQLFALPQGRFSVKIFHVREDLAQKYGMNIKPEMTTQEFFDELSKVDQSEAVPYCLSKWTEDFQIFYAPFGGYAGILKDANGNYYDGFQTQEIKDALAYIKSLYDAGLLDKEFITNENAMMREKFYTGKAAVMTDYFHNHIQMRLQANNVEAPTDLLPIYTLVGPNGDKGNVNEATQNSTCISANTKNPQRAVDLIAHWWYSEEGATRSRIGIEGSHFTIEDGIITPTTKALDSGYSLSPGGFTQSLPVISNLPFKWGGIGDDAYPKQLEILENTYKDGNLGQKHVPPSGVSDLYDKNSPGYLQNMKEVATKIVLGNATIDQAFADYDAYWKSIQGDEMLAQLNS